MRKGWKLALLALAGMVGGAVWVWLDRPLTGQSLRLEPADCVAMCVQAINRNSVFPNFHEIVQRCDERFAAGCEIYPKEDH
jgi:hypothetical protein